jgi:hypothetical protein
MWGVPGAAVHDDERYCPYAEDSTVLGYEPPECSRNLPERPFLTAPTACSGQLSSVVEADAYQAPGDYVARKVLTSAGMTGCDKVDFSPTVAVKPESNSADSPTGVRVEIRVPQEESAKGLAEADLRKATVTMPEGVTVNPAAAAQLSGCALEGAGGINLHDSAPGKCPDSSKIGRVELETPMFPSRVFRGGVYIAQQDANPFGSLLAIYVAIDEPETGVVIKLAGHVSAAREVVNGKVIKEAGQLTTTFTENPQLPFENLRLTFFGGERAPLVMPRTCGAYATASVLEPWSHTEADGSEGTPNATPSSSFSITSGPGGSACGASPFTPTLEAGTSNNQAGGYTPFVMTLSRKDGEQRFSTVSMTMPQGLAGMIAKVPLCSDGEALADKCSAASQIGHVVAQVGVGGEPDTLPEPGRRKDPVYLLGPTEGAPFGLAIVVHPEAGPFNLEEHGLPVIVLAKLEVNPTTAQVTVVSKAMPAMLQGIPVDLKTVHVVIDRPEFMFNPTSCEPTAVTGTIGSQEGASAGVSNRFQAANCASLAFKPSFVVSTQGSTSRKNGASLVVKVASGAGQANIGRVDVSLPTQLPARNDTLKLACGEAVFAANPAACPQPSRVGTATAVTPILASPLTGPAYLVSHGGAAFPDLEIVLQGEGFTIVLDGKTNINGKTGITSSSFDTVPDAPISSFQLSLPEGPHSILAAPGGKLCTQNLAMPTSITGHNGAQIKKSTPIEVTGCPYTLSILKRKVRNRTVTLNIAVPQAGRLVAAGKGVTRRAKTAKGRSTLTLTLKERHAGKLHTKITLRFTPTKGKQRKILRKSITVRFK